MIRVDHWFDCTEADSARATFLKVTIREKSANYAEVKFPSILPAPNNWPSAIGNFLLNFGALDYNVFVFLKDHLSAEEFSKIRELHFKDRLLRLGQILESQGKADEFATLFADIEPIRQLRNDIAHGHLLLNASENGPISITLFNPKDIDLERTEGAKHLDFDRVVNATLALRDLIDAIQALNGFTLALKATKDGAPYSVTSFAQSPGEGPNASHQQEVPTDGI